MKFSSDNRSGNQRQQRGFTLIELILVMMLLIIMVTIVTPKLMSFFNGRKLDSEVRQFVALTHYAQSRAVSEGVPMLLWVDEKNGAYGLTAEMSTKTTTDQTGDPKAENLTVDSTLILSVLNTGTTGQTLFNNHPAIRFLADGTVDEESPQTVQLTDSAGVARWLVESPNHTGYEVSDIKP